MLVERFRVYIYVYSVIVSVNYDFGLFTLTNRNPRFWPKNVNFRVIRVGGSKSILDDTFTSETSAASPKSPSHRDSCVKFTRPDRKIPRSAVFRSFNFIVELWNMMLKQNERFPKFAVLSTMQSTRFEKFEYFICSLKYRLNSFGVFSKFSSAYTIWFKIGET